MNLEEMKKAVAKLQANNAPPAVCPDCSMSYYVCPLVLCQVECICGTEFVYDPTPPAQADAP